MTPTGTLKKDGDLWEELLSSLQTSTNTRKYKTVIVVGSKKSGKSTLLARMLEQKDVGLISGDPGVEFNFVDVKDDDKELLGRMGIYTTSTETFLPHFLTKERIEDTLIVINLSLAEPWTIEDDLLYWSSIIEQHLKDLEKIQKHHSMIENGVLKQMRQRVSDLFSSYVAPDARNDQDESSNILLPIPDGALTTNLGVPVIVCVSKVDMMGHLTRENDFSEEHFEYVQWHIRKFCLAYGAGLVYCSPRDNTNTKLLLDYVRHLLFGMEFNMEAQAIEPDGIFVPIGWDSPAKIAVISDGFINFKKDKAFGDQIKKLSDVRRKQVIKCEDDQLFLARMQAILQEKSKSPSAQHKVLEGEAKASTRSPPPGDGVLANFFNSLLQKKPGGRKDLKLPLTVSKSADAVPQSEPSQGPSADDKPESPGVTQPKPEPLEVTQPKPDPPRATQPTLPKPGTSGAVKRELPKPGSGAAPKKQIPGSGRDKSPGKALTKKPAAQPGVKNSAVKRGLPQPKK